MAEVATLSSQQAITGTIMAPAVGAKVTVTSISQAQQLIARTEARLRQLDGEWDTVTDAALKWERLANTASSDSLRAASQAKSDQYTANGDILMRESLKVIDNLTYYRSEFERLRTAIGLPASPTVPSTKPVPPPPQPPATTRLQLQIEENDRKRRMLLPSGSVTGFPFGLTRNQAMAAVGIPFGILLVMNLAEG